LANLGSAPVVHVCHGCATGGWGAYDSEVNMTKSQTKNDKDEHQII